MKKRKLAIFVGSVLGVLILAILPLWFASVQNLFLPPLIQNYHCYGIVTNMEKIEQKMPLVEGQAVLVHYLITVNDSAQFRLYPVRTSAEEWDLVKEKIEKKALLHFYGSEDRYAKSFFVKKITLNNRIILTQKRFE